MRSPVILRVFKDSQLVEVKQFDLDQIVIGHQAEVQLDLPGEGVSPIHCLIEMRDSGHYLCDLGSKNGTFKNGQAVLDEALGSGDEIGVGPYRIVFYVGVPKPKTAPVGNGASVAPVAAAVIASAPVPSSPETPQAKPVEVAPESSAPKKPTAPPPAELDETVVAKLPTEKPKPEKEDKKSKSVGFAGPAALGTVATVVPSRPSIRAATSVSSRRKNKTTFAPPSEIKDLSSHLQPGKGNVVEVIVAWRERILETYHFRSKGVYRVGPTDRDVIRVATSELPRNWALLDIGSAVRVNVADAMKFELISTTQGRRQLDECIASGKATRSGQGTSLRLDQNEMVCLNFGDSNINIFVRFSPAAATVPMMPPLGLSGGEFSGLVTAFILTSLLAFYISATTPKDLLEEKQEEVTRTAQVIFNTPPPRDPTPVPPPPPPPEPEKKPPPPPEPQKAKAADVQRDAQKKSTSTVAKKAETAGRAAEVAPIPNSQNRPKKFTSTKQGAAIKLGKEAGANANMGKDVSKMGLFSAFGGGGVRAKLDQASSGAGEVLGQADKATGTSGFAENREGDDLGSKFKDTGAGGKGTATQGIAGIGTKTGRGTGTYGSLDGFGSKTSVAVEAGGAEEDFIGTIDREAVRRRVRHYLHEIRGCYNRELNKLEKGQRLEGKVVVSWEIIAKGVARNVRIKSSTLGNAAVENCIKERLASWNFPEPPVGLTAEVAYPFLLKAEN